MPSESPTSNRPAAPATGYLGRILAALCCFTLGLALVSALVAYVANPVLRPQRDTGMPSEKLRELAAVAPQIDVLVLGTSRLLHGFDPRVFEAETTRLGRPLRAYNLSLQRLLLWEQAQVLDDALALPGFKPKLVLLEPAVGLGISPENFTHARTVDFETPTAWRLAARTILGSDRSPPHKAWNLATHSVVGALHATHYGLYTDTAFPARATATDPEARLTPELRGFVAKPDRPPAEKTPDWLAGMASDYAVRYPHDSADRGVLPEPMRAHFAELHRKLAARGITLVFVQPPQLGFTTPELRELTYRFPAALRQGTEPARVVSFLNPAAHPALFEPRWWVDYNHVTAGGARLFTAELARELLREPRFARAP